MIFDQKLDSFLHQRADKTSFAYQYGYCNFGPFLYGFARWLHQKLSEKAVDNAYFLSRDGELILKVYLALYPEEAARCHYLYSSRRSWIFPTFAYAEMIDDVLPAMFEKRENLKSLLKKLALADENLNNIPEDILQTRFFTLEALKKSKKHWEILQQAFPAILKKAKEELGNFKQYLRQEALSGKIALVDIGWYGRTQMALEKVAEKEGWVLDISGLYAGVLPFSTLQNVDGYIFDAKHRQNYHHDKFRGALKVFESFFVNREGSTVGFRMEKGKIIATQEDVSPEGARLFEPNYDLQAGALAFVREFVVSELAHDYANKEVDFWIKGIEKTLITATSREVSKEISAFYFDHGSKDTRPLVEAKSAGYYLLHPRRFRRDLAGVVWLNGFFVETFKLRLPYYLLLKVLP
jgi:predicted HAD superfamily hydrolase